MIVVKHRPWNGAWAETIRASQGHIDMFGPFRQRRKTITCLTLGVWLFAFFVGVANACGWLGSSAAAANLVAAKTNDRSGDADSADCCEKFCRTDIPVVAKLPPIDEPSVAQLQIVTVRDMGVIPFFAPARRPVPATHPPPGAPPPFLRFTHLRL